MEDMSFIFGEVYPDRDRGGRRHLPDTECEFCGYYFVGARGLKAHCVRVHAAEMAIARDIDRECVSTQEGQP